MGDDSVSRFKGLVLVPSRQEMLGDEELEECVGIFSRGVDVPGRWYDFAERMQPLYFDQPIDDSTLQQIKAGIHSYFEEQAYPFIVVTIPPQKITSAVLQVEVEVGNVGKIAVEGNQWTADQTLLEYIGLSSGHPISEAKLLKGVQFMNRNPFRRVDAIYSPGERENQTDITLAVQEERIYHLYTGADNTGVPTTGRNRYFVGLTWNQIFGLDHVLFYQYTTSQSFHTLQAHTLQYLAFLSNQTILTLYGGYSTVHVHLKEPSRKSGGENGQGSVRYTVPLNSVDPFVHELTFGFDFKQTNNTVEFVDQNPIIARPVNLTQWMGGYRLKTSTSYCFNDLNFELYGSPVEWLPNQENSHFDSLRPGAKNQWVYFRGSWRHEHTLFHSWQGVLLSRFEWASIPLLPSEQLGIGGYESVRGYDERQLDADTGGFLSAELRTPSFRVFTKKNSSKQDMALFLLFVDGGVSYDKVAVPTTKKFDYLIGAGPGIRYSFSSYLNGRLDMGFKLHNKATFTGGSPMFHFSLIGNY